MPAPARQLASSSRNVFSVSRTYFAAGDYIERPVPWRAAALRAPGVAGESVTVEGEDDSGLYRCASARGVHAAHVAEIVAHPRVRESPG
jgi:hypothetical protein